MQTVFALLVALLLTASCDTSSETARADTAAPDTGVADDTGVDMPDSAMSTASTDSAIATDTHATMDSEDGSDTSAPADVDSVSPPASSLIVIGGRLPGGEGATLFVIDGRITEVRPGSYDPTDAPADAEVLDVAGRWLTPTFIDSHVHLIFRPAALAMARRGVGAAVDLAAPVAIFETDLAPLQVIAAGPMIVAPGGYPTESWGRNGYGLEVVGVDAATDAVQTLVSEGAGVIKIALTSGPQLRDDEIAAVIAEAHQLGVNVCAHALDAQNVLKAANAGADCLAHMPVSPLPEATLDLWSLPGRAVITTLTAFGGTGATANAMGIRSRGGTLLYGTDFGNTITAGIQGNELEAMASTGMSGAAILAAGTEVPAAFWGMADLGQIAVGFRASFLVLDADPHSDPLTLASPAQVWLDGVRVDISE